jgi:hypothetical protein
LDFSNELLVESKSLREEGILKLKIQNSEQKILTKVKQLFFAVWRENAWTTRQDLADFYEVSVENIDSNYQRHKDEFESDGVEVIRGLGLKEAKRIMRLPSTTSQETIYTSAGALRMGFILRDSEIAKTVRTIAIKFIQGIGQKVETTFVLQCLTQSYPALSPFIEQKNLKVSAPFSRYWQKMKSTLKKNYPYGGITYKDSQGKDCGKKTDEIRKDVQFLSTYTDNFRLQGIKELRYELASEIRAKYPHLISEVLNFEVDDRLGSTVVMFQFDDLIIEESYIEKCVGRGYIELAKEYLNVDQAYLFFVAPFGATSYAEDYIKTRLPIEYRGHVGVLTVKELAEFLYNQAMSTRRLGTMKGELTTEFKQLLNYTFPETPEIYYQPSLFDVPPENDLLT